MKAALPGNEPERLEALYQYQIIEAIPNEAFNDFTRLAAQICETPIALIRLIGHNQQWVKSTVGLTEIDATQEIVFSTETIRQNQVLVVQDALADERFATYPLVVSKPYIRFYAGVPLITSQGLASGTICVMDYEPRKLNLQQLEALQALGRQVITQLELRQNLVELAQAKVQKKHAERQLHSMEEEFLDVLENGTFGLHCVDAKGMILWANKTQLELLGYVRDEYVGRHVADFHADKAIIEDILNQQSANKILQDYEARLLCKDGSVRYVLIDTQARFEDGKYSHTRYFIRDITERKHAQEATQQAITENLRLARAIASVSDGVLICDPNQPEDPIIYSNPAFSRITGYQPEDVLGHNCRFLQGSGTDSQTLAEIRQAIANRQDVKATLLNYRKDGSAFWNELKISPVFSLAGDLLYFVGIQTDITERKLAEEERDRFFTLSLDLQCIAGFDGYFKRLNPAFEKTLGYTNAQLKKQPFLEFVHPQDCTKTIAELEKLTTGEPTVYFENRYRARNGSYKWLAWTAVSVIEERLIYAIARDITELKQAEQERLQLLQREQAARAEAEVAQKHSTTILESITDAFFSLDREWRFTYLNPQAELLLQKNQAQLLGKNVWDEFPEAIGRTFYQEYHRAVSENVSVAFEEFYPPLDTWFRIHAYPSKDGLSVYFNDITLARRQQEALRQSEERFRNLVETTSDLVWEIDENAIYTYASPKIRDLLGYEPEDVLGKTPFNFMPSEEAFRFANSFGSIAANRQPFSCLENTAIHKNGHLVVLETSGVPLVDVEGKFRGYRGIARDITRRKSVQEELRDLGAALENAVEGISRLDTQQRFIAVNKAYAHINGYEPEEMIGMHWQQTVHPEDAEKMLAAYEQMLKVGKAEAEVRGIRKDGSIFYKQVVMIAAYNGQKQRIGHHCFMKDITERQQAQQKISEQAALLDVATDAILVKDLNSKILFWNKGAERLFGWKAEEAIGKNADELLYEENSPHDQEVWKTLIKTGEWQGKVRKVTKDGKEVIVESRWTLVRNEAEQAKSILVVNTDITQKKQLEMQFLRAQRMESIGTLAGGIAHDLNNVLAPILMAVQLLELKLTDERSQQWLKILENNAKRGADLVKQVVSFARGIEGDRTIIQVRHIISEIKQIARETFPKLIEFNIDIPEDLWTVSGDTTQLHQVFMNLCVNARDAMADGGTLSIYAENFFIDDNYVRLNLDAKVGAYIVVTVSDTGIGIPSENLNRIFEPFFTTKEVGMGTGLGLSTVIGIVKSHGGFVNVYSELGQGTRFKVYLPAIEDTQTSIVEDPELPLGNGELILVVDDEAAIRKITQTSLETYDYTVLTASDGIEAIALYAQHRKDISLVLVDMMMPSMDGPTTIRTLQKINPQVKIIAVSGLESSNKISVAMGVGVKAFLSKPYTAKELMTTISTVLSGK